MPFFNPTNGSGHSSSPGLPVWTFNSGTGGNPASGHFQLDNAAPSSATNIYFNTTPKNGGLSLSNLLNALQGGTQILLVDSTGKPYVFSINGVISSSGSLVTIPVSSKATDATALSGDYQFSFASTPQALATILATSSITPVGNATVDGAVTTQDGIVTAVTPNNPNDGTFALSATLGGSITITNGRVTAFTTAS